MREWLSTLEAGDAMLLFTAFIDAAKIPYLMADPLAMAIIFRMAGQKFNELFVSLMNEVEAEEVR